MAGDLTLLQLGSDEVWALRAHTSPSGATLTGWTRTLRPPEVPASDSAAIGAWVGKVLDEHRLPKARVMLCLPRGEVVLKVLSLPPAPAGGDLRGELPSMVRLQMIRQLTLPAEGTAIDFFELPGDASGQRRVLAAALPADRLAWWRAVAAAAGIKLRHIGLTSAGLAALVADVSQRRDGPVLALACFGQHVELVVVESGVMILSRSVEIVGDLHSPASAERLEVECRRTWASHHGAKAGSPASVVWVGDGPQWALLAERCGIALQAPGLALASAEGLRTDPHLAGGDASWALPLGGLALSLGLGRPLLDFENPRKAPDLSARTRQGVLAAIMLAIVLGGLMYILADRALGRLRRDLDSVRVASAELRTKVAAFRVLHARAGGLEAWRLASPDWMEHLAHISKKFPDPRVVQFSSLSGAASGGAAFAPKGNYPGGDWSPQVEVRLGLDGKMDDRGPVADLREALLGMGDYVVMSKGADVASSFSLELSTSRRTPAKPAKAAPPANPAKPQPLAPDALATPKEGAS